MDDVLVNKAATIERCIRRIREEDVGHEDEFETNFTRQDSIILNLQRACEMAIDMGTRLVRLHRLGVPQTSRDVFALLEGAGLLAPDLAAGMAAMVGFRNIAVNDYRTLNLAVTRALIETRLDDLLAFARHALTLGPAHERGGGDPP